MMAEGSGEVHQSERVSEQQTPEETNEGLSLVSVFRGHKLHPTVWTPTSAESAKALVYLCHGVGEYMGCYNELGSYLSQNDLLVFGHDHIGHGRSEGERVHVEDVDTYVQDVILHVELIKNEYPHLPCILMGHSMGGLVAGQVAIQRADLFTSLILSAAAVETRYFWFINKLIQLVGRVVPQLGLVSVNPNDISSIPEEVERYVNDPLVWHGALKTRWAAAMITSIGLFRDNVDRITLPLLLMHGREDNLVPISASHFINKNASSQEKRFEVFEGSRHEVLHDKEQERAREIIKDWVLTHLTAPEPVSEPASQPLQESIHAEAELTPECEPDTQRDIVPQAPQEEEPELSSTSQSVQEDTNADT